MEQDPLLRDAAELILKFEIVSASMLQRKLILGYNRANKIMDQLEQLNMIGPINGTKPRKILFTDLSKLD